MWKREQKNILHNKDLLLDIFGVTSARSLVYLIIEGFIMRPRNVLLQACPWLTTSEASDYLRQTEGDVEKAKRVASANRRQNDIAQTTNGSGSGASQKDGAHTTNNGNASQKNDIIHTTNKNDGASKNSATHTLYTIRMVVVHLKRNLHL